MQNQTPLSKPADAEQEIGKGLDETPCCASSESEWKPDYTKTPRRVVCAANRRKDDGRIICGARHWDKVMRSQITDVDRATQWDQGFIDQFGDWMTREEAWIVAVNQNQVRRRCGGDGERLFSENLY
jgi:hypothetical protein